MSTAIELLKAECNRYVNGKCTTRRCVVRGMDRAGMTFPLKDYAVATCEHHEAVCEVETLRDLVECLIENDPNEAITDAGHTVLDKWRYDAQLALESKTE